LGNSAIECRICRDMRSLCDELAIGAGAVLLSEEAISDATRQQLATLIAAQPPWSDLPVLVMTRRGADSRVVADAVSSLGNVTLLERPTRVSMLLSAVRTALRARQRQYQIRSHLVQQEQAEKSLREADRRKDEFLAMLAHELRNPLAPMRNSLHLLRLAGDSNAALDGVREMMERQINHMVRLVDELLEVSRITRGKIELRKEHVTLSTVIDSAVETSKPLFETAGHQLTIELPSEPLVFDADPVRLTQVFANLLNNATRYTPPGGKIWLTAHRDAGYAEATIRDTGIGIPAEMLPRVFDIFTQIDPAHRGMQAGLGIGLTLVRSLVQMHGGSVTAFSQGLGHGSEFVVRLPLVVHASPDVRPRAQSKPPPDFAHHRIMVVDDNQDAADSLGMLLHFLGAEVSVAHSGAAALQSLAEQRPAVMLLDIGMPEMDGYELARRVREHPEFQDVVLIALTGWGQEEDRRRTEAAGFDHHLIKPADLNTLRGLLNSLEESGRLKDAARA
jgi:signal transduction histidine kinase/ActR/RegA family two-component response regulator